MTNKAKSVQNPVVNKNVNQFTAVLTTDKVVNIHLIIEGLVVKDIGIAHYEINNIVNRMIKPLQF